MDGTVRKRSVNWRDGMKVRREHFTQMDDYVDDRIRDTIFVSQSRMSFGHLSAPVGVEISTSDGEDRRVSITLASCCGITAGGHRVQIPWGERHLETLRSGPLPLHKGVDNYVAVRVHEEKVPAGEVADEIPTRQKDSVSRYTLELLTPEMAASEATCLPVAKIPIGQCAQDLSYVPPCMRIASHHTLLDAATEIVSLCSEMTLTASRVVVRELGKPIPDKDIVELAKVTAQTIAVSIDSFHIMYRELPPYRLIAFVAGLARSVGIARALSKRSDFADPRFKEFETDVLKCAQEYKHYDVGSQLKSISSYVKSLSDIFKKMAQGGRGDIRIVE